MCRDLVEKVRLRDTVTYTREMGASATIGKDRSKAVSKHLHNTPVAGSAGKSNTSRTHAE